MSHDEMVSEPKKSYLARCKREASQILFLVPTGFDPKAMGEVFEQIGKEMKTGCTSGRNWKVVQDIHEQHVRLFGTKKFRSQGSGTLKDKQAAKHHPEFGHGYNEEAPGNGKN